MKQIKALRKWLLIAVEFMWTVCVFFLAYYVLAVLGSCATPSTSLTDRARIEHRMDSCRNAGGVWINPQGDIYAGKCDWNRSVL